MMRLINLNRISRTNIEENEDGYIFPYSFEDMIFENNFDVRITSLFYYEPVYTYAMSNL